MNYKIDTWILDLIVTVAYIGTIIILILALRKTLRAKNNRANKGDPETGISSDDRQGQITYTDIVEATENFSDDYVINSGTSSKVYKVVLPRQDKILAAKCLKLANHGDDDYRHRCLRQEIEVMKNAHHRNILRHRDMLTVNDVTVLVCDYMANGSLWEFLGGAPKPNKKLDWRTLYNVVVGVAEGLKYLLHDCEPPIIHCDIKSANILLDHEYVAHIVDFGLAKLLKNPSIDSESSSLLGGTHGYIARECGYGVKASTKQDVYSFGVVLLEMVSGKSPVVEEDDHKFVHLRAWVAKLMKEEKTDEIINEDLRSAENTSLHSIVKDEMLKMIEIGLFCTCPSPSFRPSMKIVLDMLISPNRGEGSDLLE